MILSIVFEIKTGVAIPVFYSKDVELSVEAAIADTNFDSMKYIPIDQSKLLYEVGRIR